MRTLTSRLQRIAIKRCSFRLMGGFFINTTSLKALDVLCGVIDVIESVHLRRTRAETKFRLLFWACETLQFSMVMTNINTKCTHSTCSDMI